MTIQNTNSAPMLANEAQVKHTIRRKKMTHVMLFVGLVILIVAFSERSGRTLIVASVYKVIECFCDVVADRLFPDSFLRDSE